MKRTRSNGNGSSSGPGRPSKYDPSTHPERARKLCLLGLTDLELCLAFGISHQTIDNWKNAHPDFLEAIRRGREGADQEIANSLYQRAKGYKHPDVHVSTHKLKKTITDSNGSTTVEEYIKPVIVDITKHYPPDTVACIFWLKNRTRHLDIPWKDVRGHEVTGKDGGPIETREAPIDLSDLSEEELAVVEKIGLQATEEKKARTFKRTK